jgi:hypothetical protein
MLGVLTIECFLKNFIIPNDYMGKETYIKQLGEENARLKKRIEELERLVGMNYKNSYNPP